MTVKLVVLTIDSILEKKSELNLKIYLETMTRSSLLETTHLSTVLISFGLKYQAIRVSSLHSYTSNRSKAKWKEELVRVGVIKSCR